jgi:hypothetical protein
MLATEREKTASSCPIREAENSCSVLRSLFWVPFFDERKKVRASFALRMFYVAGRGHRASAFSIVPVDRARASGGSW